MNALTNLEQEVSDLRDRLPRGRGDLKVVDARLHELENEIDDCQSTRARIWEIGDKLEDFDAREKASEIAARTLDVEGELLREMAQLRSTSLSSMQIKARTVRALQRREDETAQAIASSLIDDVLSFGQARGGSPLQEIGRMIEIVDLHHRSHDVGGTAKGVLGEKHERRLFGTLHEARLALYRVACDLRAETTADLVVQLSSAFVLADLQSGCEPDEDTEGDIERLRVAIGSTLGVVMRSMDNLDVTPMRDEGEAAVHLLFERTAAER